MVLAQTLQDLLVVHEPVQGAQEEGVEWQVAHLLQLEVSAQVLQPPGAPDAGLQRLQSLAVLPQVSSQLLVGAKDKGEAGRGVLLSGTEGAQSAPFDLWKGRLPPLLLFHFVKFRIFHISRCISLFQLSSQNEIKSSSKALS